MNYHHAVMDRETIVNNTKTISSCSNIKKLRMLEAVVIRERAPVINVQSNLMAAIPLSNNVVRHETRTSGTPPPPPPPTPPNPPPPVPVSEVGGQPVRRRSARVRSR